MDWLRIVPAQVTLPGHAVVCDQCHRTMYRLTLGEAQAAAMQHLEEEHNGTGKRRIFSDLTPADLGDNATPLPER